jgi:hypothetical protein
MAHAPSPSEGHARSRGPVLQRIDSFLAGQPRTAAFCRDCLAALLEVPRAMLDGPVRELVGDRTLRATLGPCAVCRRVAAIVTHRPHAS